MSLSAFLLPAAAENYVDESEPNGDILGQKTKLS